MDRRAESGEFLRSRRARLRPEELGLGGDGRRRVPGLRREEPARLAGVSVDHYVRLEQGRTLHFSEAVLDAAARALRLDDVESAHLHRLVRPWTAPTGIPAPQRVRPGLQRLLDLAADVAAYLRLDQARHPDDPRTTPLVAELSAASPEFGAVWAEHGLKDKAHGRYRYLHPVVGELDLGFESLRLPDEPDQVLIAHTFEEGSSAETSLRLLSAWAREALPV